MIAAMDPIADDPDIQRAARLAESLPGVEVSTWHGTPALKVAGKSFARVKAPGILVLLCPLETKDHLFATAPETFFETGHYKGWPALLVRMDAIDDATLAHRIEVAWLEKAPAKLVKAWSPQHVL